MEQEKKKMIEIICDRPSHIYRVGEKAKFTVNSTEPGVEFEAVFTADGEAEIARVKGVTPCTLKQTLLFPGFLRCAVTAADGSTALAGAGFDPAAIRAVLPEPDDFREFWNNALVNLEKIPADFKMEEVAESSDEMFQVFLVECNTVNGFKCYAHLRIPRDGRKMPLMIYYEGAGSGMCREDFRLHLATADKWLSERVAQLSIFTHPYCPPVTHEEHLKCHEEFINSLETKSYWNEGLDKGPEHTYFYRGILGAVRMINHVCAMECVDQERITYLGGSQGGGFGFFLSALCPQIKAATCGVPAFCDCGGFLAGHHELTSNSKAFREHYQVMRYFDPVNFAPMIKIPLFVSCGFIDTTCQSAAIYAAYNELQGNKIMFHKTCNGHCDAAPEYTALFWFWVASHMGLCQK